MPEKHTVHLLSHTVHLLSHTVHLLSHTSHLLSHTSHLLSHTMHTYTTRLTVGSSPGRPLLSFPNCCRRARGYAWLDCFIKEKVSKGAGLGNWLVQELRAVCGT